MPVSITLQDEEIERVKEYIERYGLPRIPVKSRHELLRVKDKGIGMILYKSGRLVYNDSSEMRRIIDEVLKIEKEYTYMLGTDEAGKGEWYGPLVVECVALKPREINELRKLGVKDSKKLGKRRLLDLGDRLVRLKFIRKPLILMPETYNRSYRKFRLEGKSLNDLMAWAHARAIKDLIGKLKYERLKVIIDKFDLKKMEFRLRDLDKTGVEIVQKIRGESEIPVATASILAKYIFEKQVDELDKKFGIDLRKSRPDEIPREILPYVSKIHFKNVRKVIG
ncbi:MAG: hypothetical protein DRO89_01695 [Candidatus Altiarchaeales archaeon]|nr:MAG: hypothetical protein DRO89_01695 [Candidatus Altiarchaeales archaeon]